MNLTEKAAYLKGLAEGLDISDSTKEGKLLKAIVEMLDELTSTVSTLDDDVDQIYEELDAIDEDMDDLEEYVFGDEDEDFDDEEDEDEDEEDEELKWHLYSISQLKASVLWILSEQQFPSGFAQS